MERSREVKWPIALKIVLMTVMIVIGVVVVITILTLRREQESFELETRQQLTLVLEALIGNLSDAIYFLDADTLQDTMERMGSAQVLTFGRVYDQNGRIIADTLDSSLRLSFESDPLGQLLQESDTITFRQQGQQLIAGRAVTLGRERIGAVAIGLSTAALEENLASVRNQAIVIAVLMVIIATLVAIAYSRSLTKPITELTLAARQYAQGEFTHRVSVQTHDELGVLSDGFNTMIGRLQETLRDLRQREQILETSVAISRQLSIILDEKELLRTIVEQMQSTLNYYHAHVYLLDAASEKLVMAGGTGEAGATMLAQGHSIPVGQGLVGRAAATNSVVLVPDLSQEAGWLPNPLLPETKASVAVPIAIGQELLGVLNVQHNVVNGLQPVDAELITTIANQLAVTLQNVRAYTHTQQRADQEALINTIGQRIERATTIEGVLDVAARELRQALGAKHTIVELSVKSPQNLLRQSNTLSEN